MCCLALLPRLPPLGACVSVTNCVEDRAVLDLILRQLLCPVLVLVRLLGMLVLVKLGVRNIVFITFSVRNAVVVESCKSCKIRLLVSNLFKHVCFCESGKIVGCDLSGAITHHL